MTRLLEPDLGEVLDRLAILQLKLDHGMGRNVPTAAWEEEQRQLDDYLQKKIQAWQSVATGFAQEEFGKANAELVVVNGKLWAAEDEIRTYCKTEQLTDDECRDLATLAMRIADLNDVRCNLVQKINRLFGVETQEKIYV